MNEQETKTAIQAALQHFGQAPIDEAALALFETLGYRSQRQIKLNSLSDFLKTFDQQNKLNRQQALFDEWQSVAFLFQITGEEIAEQMSGPSLFKTAERINQRESQSYLFFAVTLKKPEYSRTDLSSITRAVNRAFDMPALILFRHGPLLTLSIINRRLHKRDETKDVLEKVTLIKDIAFASPHRAHIEILYDLSLQSLHQKQGFTNFIELHEAWRKALDTSELNKRFFQDVANWYFWAIQHVKFPKDAHPDKAIRNATGVIRLITRLIFCWFVKEKGLIPRDLFNQHKIRGWLTDSNPPQSAYYKAILQNLFFATLNQEMGKREFRRDGQNMMAHTLYRHKALFKNPDQAIKLFETIPFLNGGLFECLDRLEGAREKPVYIRIDGFSDREDSQPTVPDFLFFSDEQPVDLNEPYGTSNKSYKVRGLLNIFERYKFTINENTPIEEEIALDPELLGKVFENLLAAYNPETGVTARKQTGSFYTPREIVNYMVDESLIAYLEPKLETATSVTSSVPPCDERLRHLFAYNDEPHRFSPAEVETLIQAIDRVKILDPACGSGAFPMGILHKLVFILGKLDPGNERWKARQIAKMDDPVMREQAEKIFRENYEDYGRKLYLIENCIYGVDIQPIAVQIAKLRFFISLVVDQKVNKKADNLGVRPLPNLETKFVAANALIGIERPGQQLLRNPQIGEKEAELRRVRENHFTARTPATKRKYREEDAKLRGEIGELLRADGFTLKTIKQLSHWNPYDQNASADFFDPEWMFGLTDGFDIAIGNPPYVRQEEIREMKPAFKEQYDCFTGMADLYVYFYERSIRLLKPGGILSFISSNKYFRSGYGEKLRALLGGQTRLLQIIDFGDTPVFTSIAYPCIVLLSKLPPEENQARVMTWEPGPPLEAFPMTFESRSFTMPQKALSSNGWRLESHAVLRLLEKLRKAGKPLGEYVGGRFYRGILTGLNEAFVVDRATRDRLIAEHKSSTEILKPFLRGRDVKRWQVEPQDLWLVFTRHGVDINKYPAIHEHLCQFKKKLMPGIPGGRKPGSYKWFEIQDNISYWQEFEQPKIVIPAIEQRVAYAPDSKGHYSNDKTSICVAKDVNYLLGLLNSSALWWMIRKTAATKQGGFYEFKPMYVSQLPIPAAPPPERTALEGLVDRILKAKQANVEADVSALEREIDDRVYRLYGLTPEEIAIVEEGTRS